MSYPLVPPPVSDTGAWTWPRTLQRWLDVNPVTKLTRTSTYITLPAFTQAANTWNGYSDIVASFNCESPNNFSFTGIATDVPASVNYVLCVSYRVGTTVTRYILWSAQGAVMNQTIPLYIGQPILKNFRFEIWNTSQGATSQGTAINFYTSVLGKQDYRYASDGALVVVDAENDDFSYSSTLEMIPPTAITITVINNIVIGDTYQYNLLGNGLLSDGINNYSGSGTFVASSNTITYYPYIPNPQPSLEIFFDLSGSPNPIFNLPLTFPINSVSQIN